jgi:penicillin-binding protein 1A
MPSSFISEQIPQRPKGGNIRRKVPFYQKRWFLLFLLFCLIAGVTSFLIVMAFLKPLREIAEAMPMDDLKKLEQPSVIHDRKGEEVGLIYVLNRRPIKIEQVPKHFIEALTAEEDSRFFQHGGVDTIGVIRAIWLNFKVGRQTQGASTLTQQIARDVFKLKEMEMEASKFSQYKRKIVEAYVSSRIEKTYSKSDILEFYLNRVYFGSGNYGVQAAAQGYFGKDVSQISVEESASLSCLLKNPGGLNPRLHPKHHVEQRNHVLDRMYDEHFLTAGDRDAFKQRPVILTPRSADIRLSYVYDEIRQQAMKIIGEDESVVGGFQIYTTIDRQLQKTAEEAVRKRMADVEKGPGYPNQTYDQYHAILDDYRRKLSAKAISPDTPKPQPEYLQSAVLMIDNRDGGILALVGGRDFVDSMYNRALKSRRPTGTAFIPFVYATAFQRPDYFPAVQLEDGPIDNRRVMIGGLTGILGEWGTEQDETRYSDHIAAREALVESRNAATVRLGEKIGLEPVKELVAKAGIRSPMRDYASAFLGASEARLDEVCLAYSTFPNKGKRPKEVSLIKRITDVKGRVIFQVKDDEDEMVSVMDETAAYQTHTCLEDALTRGTGRTAYSEFGLEKFPAAGKTGTHYEFKDLWFVGYTSAVTCGVWCGFDQSKPVYTGAFSNRIALPIWADAISATVKGYKPEEFAPPSDARLVEVCKKSGLRATDACYEKISDGHGGTKSMRDTYQEVIRPKTVFELYCDQHTGGSLVESDFVPKPSHDVTPLGGGAGLSNVNVQAVMMTAPTILGFDPYNSIQPAPLKAVPVNDDGTAIKRAEPVEDEAPTSAPLKIVPPPPLKIE